MPGQEVLFERMPRRRRVLSESLLVVTLFFVPPNLLAFSAERGPCWPPGSWPGAPGRWL